MTPDLLIADFKETISLPKVALEILEVADDPSSSAEDIAAVASRDPGLTAAILRIANSPIYGVRSSVDNVAQAIVILGEQHIRDLSIGISAKKSLADMDSPWVPLKVFWLHSIHCAVVAQLLAKSSNIPRAQSMFVAGLLHDIGQLLMYKKMPELSLQALNELTDGEDGLTMDQAERSTFGFDHTEVGLELAHSWGLPPMLAACMKHHHDPASADEFIGHVSLIHIANSIAVLAELQSDDERDAPPIQPQAWEACGLSPEIIPEIIAEACEQFTEASRLFTGN